MRSQLIRREDTFARYGGEEFILLLENTPIKSALKIAERIRSSMTNYNFNYKGQKTPVTVSLGITGMTPLIDSPQTLLNLADQALYQAKKLGRNRVVVSPTPEALMPQE